MPVFHNNDGKLKKLSLIPLNKEKELQRLLEKNLLEVLDMELLKSEFTTTNNYRIDTLAIDNSGSPVIIEYKKNRNDTVIPQALAYLTWLEAQSDKFFKMLVFEVLGKEKADSVNFNNPKVICIAESYNPYDVAGFKKIANLELYRYRYYENDIFFLEKISDEDERPKRIDKKIFETPVVDITKLNTEPDLEKHLIKGNAFVRNLFYSIQEKILMLDESIDIKVNNNYIAFKVSKIFAEVHIQKNKILLYLRPVNFTDPEHRIDKIPDTYNWSLNQRIYVKDESDINYVMPLIEQSYKDVL